MALQTKTLAANGAKGHHKFTLTVNENSTSVSANTSSLSFSFALSPVQTSWNWEQWGTSISYVVNINGTTYSGSIPNYDGYSSVTLKSGSLTVGHNSDGSKSISVSFSVTDSAGQYYTCGNASSSGTMTLTKIARASSISSLTSSVEVNGTNSVTVNISRASSSFTHTVEFYINSSYYQKYTGIATSKAYVIPISWYAAMPTSTSYTAYCKVTTYNGSTQIGSAVTKSFIVKVPSSITPTISSLTLDPTNVTINGTSYDYLIKGKNALKLTASASAKTSSGVATGSPIKSYTFTGPSVSSGAISSSSTSVGSVSASGTLTYKVVVTDQRGRTATITKTITCYDYYAPSFTTFDVERDGTALACTYKATCAPINGKNSTTIKIYVGGTLKYTGYGSGTANISLSSASTTYSVYATVTDALGASVNSSTKTVFGASRIMNVTKNGTGVAFGKMAESNNLLESRYRIKSPGVLTSRTLRPVDANIDPESDYLGTMEHYLATSSMTSNKPSLGDGHILHLHWDNTGGYDSQLYVKSSDGRIMSRGCNGGTWKAWRESLDSSNYTSYVSPKPTALYSTSTGNIGTVTLSDSAANFTYLEIFYTDNNGRQPHSVKVYSPNGKYVSLSCIEPSTSGSEPRVYIRTSGWTISGTSITVGRSDLSGANRGVYGQMYPHANGTNIDVKFTENNYIKIFRVLGYK